MVNVKVELESGVYTLKKPGGKVGLANMDILLSIQSATGIRGKDYNEADLGMTPAELERIRPALKRWTEEVLPHIYIEGPYPLDDIPGEDQMFLFFAMVTTIRGGDKNKPPFRIIT